MSLAVYLLSPFKGSLVKWLLFLPTLIVRGETIETVLVMAKNGVAPLENHSLPYLELLGAVITACLISAVQDALKPLTEIDDIVCWGDNLAVLFWICNCKDWKVFVQNRVTEIRKLTSVWKYVSSEDNPADCPMRRMTFAELRDCKKW